MKPPFPLRRLAAGVAVCIASAGAWALGVGRVQGVALIGRPLEVTVPLTFEPGEAVPECVQAEVFYGDTRLKPDAVTAELQPGRAGASVRVRSGPAVDEPVVTLFVHIGCGNRYSRRIVLLSEQDDRTEPVRSARTPAQAGESVVMLPTVPSAPPPARAPVPRRQGTAAAAGEPAPGASAPAAPGTTGARGESPALRTSPRVAPPGTAQAGRPAGSARLKLEPLDLSLPADPTLRSTAMLAPGLAEADPQQRAAAAALWRALNAQPEDLLRDTQRLEGLEKDLRALRQSLQRNDASVAELRTQLQQAQSQRYANGLVYTLAGLLLAALGLAGWLWRRGGSVNTALPWWNPPARDSVDSRLDPASRAPRAGSGRSTPDSETGVPTRIEPRAGAIVAAAAGTGALRTQPLAVAPAQPGFQTSDFQMSQPSTLRSLKAEELHDVQQEADFFVSLGEYERAIEVLRSHISLNPETSPVAWLDLMDIYHRLERREDYEWVRGEFQRSFNAQVPAFDAYSEEGADLEAYASAMQRIVALWPSPRVLDVIEESIFRGPAQDGAQAFTLQAYRELLLLHHIGTEVLGRAAGSSSFGDSSGGVDSGFGSGRSDFGQTSIHPLSAEDSGMAPLPGLTVPDISLDDDGPVLVAADAPLPPIDLDGGLDINLDEPSPEQDSLIGAASDSHPIELPALELPADDDFLIGDVPATAAPAPTPAPTPAPDDGNLLDFDLPEIDPGAFQTKKTRE